jgi:glycosyltransferase involved in cell wall biosynthesis
VITTHPHYPAWKISEGYGGWSQHDVHEGVRVERKLHYVPRKPRGLQRLLSELSFGARLLFARWGRPDIVVLVSPALFSSAVAGLRARWGIHKPTVVTWVQDLYSLGIVETGQGGSGLAALMGRVEGTVLRASDGVAVIHTRFKDHVVEKLNVAPGSVSVIRNWSHLVPPPNVDRDATRTRLGWRDDEIIVLHAGNMGVKQGLENVVEAARYAEQADLPLRFVLLGGGNQRDRLVALADGVDRVSFLDPLPDDLFQEALASADVLLVNEKPGIAEMAVPSKLTSYFSTGVPVIAATDKGSVTDAEIAASGGGIRVPAGDPRALAESANTLARDRALSHTLGVAGRDFRERQLSEAAAIDRYAEWLTSLATDRGR